MYDLITVGGISVDFYFKGESLTYKDNRFQLAVGGKYLADEFHYSIGGGAANVGIAAAKNGINVAVYGMLGNNQFKQMITQELSEKGVSHSLCPIANDYFNFSSILLSSSGERSIINYVSPHLKLFESDIDIKKLLNTKALFLGNLPDVSFTNRLHLLSHLKKLNVITILNLGTRDCRRPKAQLEEMLSNIDILICNGHEFAEIVEAPYKDLEFSGNVVSHYLPLMKNKIVIITEGQKGSYAFQKEFKLHQSAIVPEKIIDTTGAGDGYTGAFIAEYIKTKKISRAMEKGAHYATKIMQKIGAN